MSAGSDTFDYDEFIRSRPGDEASFKLFEKVIAFHRLDVKGIFGLHFLDDSKWGAIKQLISSTFDQLEDQCLELATSRTPVSQPLNVYNLCVELPDSKFIVVQATASTLVATVKAAIQEQANIPSIEQELLFIGHPLDDSAPLSLYNLPPIDVACRVRIKGPETIVDELVNRAFDQPSQSSGVNDAPISDMNVSANETEIQCPVDDEAGDEAYLKFLIYGQDGGMPSQKRKMISVVDLRPLDDDPQDIKNIFAETVFNGSTWLGTMTKDALTEYLSILESKKTIANHVDATVSRIPSFAAMKV